MHTKMVNLMGVLVIVVSQIPFECHGALNSFEMKKLDCVFDEKYFNQNDSECVMKEEDGRNKFAGGHGELATAIDEDVVTNIELYMGSSLANGQYHLLFNFSQNVCHLAEQAKATVIGSFVRPLWEAYTDIPFGCPIKAGKYTVNDIDYESLAQLIPITVPSGRFKIVIKVHHESKLVMSITTVVMVQSLTGESAAKKTTTR